MTDETRKAIEAEVVRARSKFPAGQTVWQKDFIHMASAVVEEAGELMRAAIQCTYEAGSGGAMRREAVQTAAVCVRFLENG